MGTRENMHTHMTPACNLELLCTVVNINDIKVNEFFHHVYSQINKNEGTLITVSFWTDRPELKQCVPSVDQGLHCFQFYLHLFEQLGCSKLN